MPTSSGRDLIDEARRSCEPGESFDPLHIVRAALEHLAAYPDIQAAFSPPVLADEGRRAWLGFISTALAADRQSAYQYDTETETLRDCRAEWNRLALALQGDLTGALVLWTILGRHDITKVMVDRIHLEPVALMDALTAQLVPTPRQPAAAPLGTASDVEEIVQHLPGIIAPSAGLRFKDLRSVDVDMFLNALGDAAGQGMATIANGPRGSLVEALGHALADRLANHGPFLGPQAPLQEYRAVEVLDLHPWLADATPPSPHLILGRAKALAAGARAILLVDGLEVLAALSAQTSRADAAAVVAEFADELARPGGALVCGLYRYPAGQHPAGGGPRPNLGPVPHDRVKLINMPPYSAVETRVFLRAAFFPEWERLGFRFRPDAFDIVTALEPGAWMYGRRMTLPYLAVMLGDDSVATAVRGDAVMRDTFAGALLTLARLSNEQKGAATDAALARRIAPVLEQAEYEIRQALDASKRKIQPVPLVPRRDGFIELTRAHVAAQLLDVNESEFHYPNNKPG